MRYTGSPYRSARWLELSERAFIFANQAKIWFENGSLSEKREILACLGSNLLLEDRKLRVELKKPFLIMKEGGDCGGIRAIVEDVRTFFTKTKEYFRIPIFKKKSYVSSVAKGD